MGQGGKASALQESTPNADNSSYKVIKRYLPIEDINATLHLSVDFSQLFMASCSTYGVMWWISPCAAVLSIAAAVASTIERYLGVFPSLRSFFVVVDGANPLKSALQAFRRSKISPCRDHVQKEARRLDEEIGDSYTAYQAKIAELDALSKPAIEGIDRDSIRADCLLLLLGRFRSHEKVVFLKAPGECEVLQASLARLGVMPVSKDYDMVTLRVARWILLVKDNLVEVYETSRLFADDFVNNTNMLEGVFFKYDSFGGLPFAFYHVLVGCDYFFWGGQPGSGLRGCGPAMATSILAPCVRDLCALDPEPSFAHVFDTLFKTVLQCTAWRTLAKEEPAVVAEKTMFFKRSVLYFYHCVSVSFVSPPTVPLLDGLHNRSLASVVRCHLNPLPSIGQDYLNENDDFDLASSFTLDNLYMNDLMQSGRFGLVTSASFAAYSDLNADRVMYLRLLGSADMVSAVAQGFKLSGDTSRLNSRFVVALGIKSAIVNLHQTYTPPICDQCPREDFKAHLGLSLGEGDNFLHLLSAVDSPLHDLNVRSDVGLLHPVFLSGQPTNDVNATMLSKTTMQRRMFIAFGGITSEAFALYRVDDGCNDGKTLIAVVARNVTPSMRSTDLYTTSIVFQIPFAADDDWSDVLITSLSHCNCDAGNSSFCAHQGGLLLCLGILLEMSNMQWTINDIKKKWFSPNLSRQVRCTTVRHLFPLESSATISSPERAPTPVMANSNSFDSSSDEGSDSEDQIGGTSNTDSRAKRRSKRMVFQGNVLTQLMDIIKGERMHAGFPAYVPQGDFVLKLEAQSRVLAREKEDQLYKIVGPAFVKLLMNLGIGSGGVGEIEEELHAAEAMYDELEDDTEFDLEL